MRVVENSWKTPNTKKHIQAFLGFANYYREFIKYFAAIAAPLIKLIKKDIPFAWPEEAEQAFQKLKTLLTTYPVLQLPNDEGRYKLTCDASDVAIAGILHQLQKQPDGSLKDVVIAYGSRALRDCERNYGAPKAEMLGIVYFTEQYRQYLLGKTFVIQVDNSALAWLKTYSMSSPTVSRWIQRLDQFHFTIEHVPRDKNTNADGLSKKTEYLEIKEQDDPNQVMECFPFLDKTEYEKLPVLREELDKKGKPIDKTEMPEGGEKLNVIADNEEEEHEDDGDEWERDESEGDHLHLEDFGLDTLSLEDVISTGDEHDDEDLLETTDAWLLYQADRIERLDDHCQFVERMPPTEERKELRGPEKAFSEWRKLLNDEAWWEAWYAKSKPTEGVSTGLLSKYLNLRLLQSTNQVRKVFVDYYEKQRLLPGTWSFKNQVGPVTKSRHF